MPSTVTWLPTSGLAAPAPWTAPIAVDGSPQPGAAAADREGPDVVRRHRVGRVVRVHVVHLGGPDRHGALLAGAEVGVRVEDESRRPAG